MSNKLATNTCSLPLYQEISYLSRPSDTLIMKSFMPILKLLEMKKEILRC